MKVHETGTISGHQNWHWNEHETGRALPPDRIAWASRDRVDPRPDLSRSDARGAGDFWLSARLMLDSLPVSRSLSCQFRAPSHARPPYSGLDRWRRRRGAPPKVMLLWFVKQPGQVRARRR